jgi:hypothetical protein
MCEADAVKLSQWLSRSMTGHIVLFEVIFSFPFLVWFAASNYSDGTLTLSFFVQFLLLDVLAGAAGAFAIWHTVTLPLIRRTKHQAGNR